MASSAISRRASKQDGSSSRSSFGGAANASRFVAGERRVRASVLAGPTTIPVQVRTLDDVAARRVLLVENLQQLMTRRYEQAAARRMLRARPDTPAPVLSKAKILGKLTERLLCGVVGRASRRELLRLAFTGSSNLHRGPLSCATEIRALSASGFRNEGGGEVPLSRCLSYVPPALVHRGDRAALLSSQGLQPAEE
jgi:hypothetical protein